MQEQPMRDERRTEIPREESDRFMTTEPGDYEAQQQESDYEAQQQEPLELERENTNELQDPNTNRTAMFEANETNDFRSRWQSIQTDFIDDPRRCVERADELVSETMKRLSQIFSDERTRLEQSWDQGDNVSTEDLRLAFQRYRSFFDRLLSV